VHVQSQRAGKGENPVQRNTSNGPPRAWSKGIILSIPWRDANVRCGEY